jgi:RHS repeat-associated protein
VPRSAPASDETLAYPCDALHRRAARQWSSESVLGANAEPTMYLTALDCRILWDGPSVAAGSGVSASEHAYMFSAVNPMALVYRDRWTVWSDEGAPEVSRAFEGRTYAQQDVIGNTSSTRTLGGAADGMTERYLMDPYGGNVLVLDNAFAVKSGSDIGWNILFQGGMTDLSGLIQFGAREYDPDLGRWLQQDPIGWPDGANRYEAMRSGPGAWVDPDGLSAVTNDLVYRNGMDRGAGPQNLGLGGTAEDRAAAAANGGGWVKIDARSRLGGEGHIEAHETLFVDVSLPDGTVIGVFIIDFYPNPKNGLPFYSGPAEFGIAFSPEGRDIESGKSRNPNADRQTIEYLSEVVGANRLFSLLVKGLLTRRKQSWPVNVQSMAQAWGRYHLITMNCRTFCGYIESLWLGFDQGIVKRKPK